ncbi:phospholipid scramblase 1-like isoform X1 [Haliotis rufescens]|uniref:phospholipid scramblase 1-like isoform X1 n=1 Tax=Haliotis rufescens TaxID=6454 RepID=UPI001EB009FD|nr:phospholipid scramblase 1-like isoform X1 [Haliotis rufescens]
MSVTRQPGLANQNQEVTWMPAVGHIQDCPPGLEYLSQLDQILIEQQVNLIEVLLSWECNNKYRVMNSMSQQCYYAAEKSGTFMRQCCGSDRAFTIHIVDNIGQEVLRMRRDFKCCGGCCWCADADCAAHEVIVETAKGEPLGYVRQLPSKWKGHYGILDSRRNQLMEIWGPCCGCQGLCCTDDVEFPVQSMKDGAVVSKISKQWGGAVREIFTDAEKFSVTFPQDLDVKVKATLMGAVFLIHFMYYEEEESSN